MRYNNLAGLIILLRIMNKMRRRVELWNMKRQIEGKKEDEEKLRFLLNVALQKDKNPENQKYYKKVLEELNELDKN